MDVTLSTGTPSADATGLTEGAAYSFFHDNPVTASVYVGAAWMEIYESTGQPGGHIPRLVGTAIRFRLAGGATAATVSVV